ncbi:hypothetical protein [Streptomyces sp.]|uniref:hypothetical protein n=1 Tax=Streptomyces sp. TaxID=1931 RepID=UPI002F42B905
MTQNAWPPPGPGGRPPQFAQQQEVELPLQLQGPFVREFVPQTTYKHRGAQIASVVFYGNGGHSVITVRGSQHHGKPMFGRPTSVCHIARGRHQVSFEMELPTLGDQANFQCAVDVNWEVQDFHLVAEKRVVDVEKMLRPPLLARLRMITRRHRLDGAQAADEAIQAELADGRWTSFGADLGLATEVFVRIDLGRAAADHNQDIVQVRHNATVQSAIDQAAAARVKANLPAARQLIEAGEAEHYVHLLAQDPARAADVLGALQIQAKEQRQGALEYLTRLIDQGIVQRHQVEGQVQMLIDFARTVGGKVFEGGLPQPATALATPPVIRPAIPPGAPQPEDGAAPSAPAAQTPPLPPMPPLPPVVPVSPVVPAPPAAVNGTAGPEADGGPAVPDGEGESLDGQGG